MTRHPSTIRGLPLFGVILAGGSGTRFWPKSRQRTPKQLCKIGDSPRTMIENTLSRLDSWIDPNNRLIVTHRDQYETTKSVVGNACRSFLPEPKARNTAAALGLAAFEIAALQNGSRDAIMISLHADHIVKDLGSFQLALRHATHAAAEGFLTLVGIAPDRPETGFGYIEQGPALALEGVGESAPAFRVASFKEKPSLEVAREYLRLGRYLWNSGMFVMRVDVFLRELREFAPRTYEGLSRLTHDGHRSVQSLAPGELDEIYEHLPNIAVDNAVFERSKNVAVIAAEFGWADVGSWDALPRCFGTDADKNHVVGNAVLLESTGMVVDSDGPTITCLGAHDLVVVAAHGAILVCPKDRAQDVKKIVDLLKSQGRDDLILG